jgi:glucose-1-phosphate adenylyltransferase
MLFNPERPIWTKLRDEMPTRYAAGAKVCNSLVADGCVIEGTVEDSVIFRGVTVAPGASVRGCIIMQDAIISRNAELENCILDKLTTVREDKRLVAPSTFPIVVGKNLVI